MAESHNDTLAEHKRKLDEGMANVMPDYWEGHGRLEIEEAGFEGKKRTFARRLLSRLNEKYPEKDSETLAEKAIEETEKRLG